MPVEVPICTPFLYRVAVGYCHTTTTWRPVARVDHAQVTGSCYSCHNGTTATGKHATHIQSTNNCAACHATGAAGAPKLGDVAAWGPRIKTGVETLLASALKGKGAMGAQGGGDFNDFEIHRAVVYLANQGGAKFDEPKAPAAAASAAK